MKTYTSIVFIIAIIFNSLWSFSQVKTGEQLEWSESFLGAKVNKMSYITFRNTTGAALEIIGQWDETLILKAESNLTPDLIFYNTEQLRETRRIREFTPMYNNQKYDLRLATMFQNRLIIVAKVQKKAFEYSDEDDYIIQIINPKFMDVEETIKVGKAYSYHTKSLSGDSYFRFNEQVYFKNPDPPVQFITSNNGEKLVCMFMQTPKDGPSIKYHYYYFDSKLKYLKYGITLDSISNTKYQRENILLTDSGKLYMIYYTEDNDTVNNKYFFEFANGNTVKLGKDYMPIKQKLFEHNGIIRIVGTCFKDKKFYLYTTDYINFELNYTVRSLTPINISQTLVLKTPEFIELLNENREKLPFLNYQIDEVIYLADGSTLIYGEVYKYKIRTQGSHHTNEIIVIKLNEIDDVEYLKVIPKVQRFGCNNFEVPSWGSYISFISDNNLHFIFEDHPKLYKDPTSAASIINKSDQTSEYVLSIEEGDIRKRIWLNNRERQIYPSPSQSIDLKEGKYLIGSCLKNKFRFAILNY